MVVACAAVGTANAAGSEDDRAEGVPSDYWTLPVPTQGEAPANWSELERTLTPDACATCHEERHAEWRTSLHAKAFSSGVAGQLVAMAPSGAASCMRCHAPLTEQQEDFVAALNAGTGHVPDRQGLASESIVCAACHVRGHRRFGPPQRETGATGYGDSDAPHGGVTRVAWFESSDFCAPCHQFSQAFAINGKPLENTVAEWRASPFARADITCQECHMPGRRHFWRGIHDPDMVASGLTVRIVGTADGARFSLTNSGVGHAFPTYVTPRVEMRGVLLDSTGREVPGSALRHVIARDVAATGGVWVERRDSRLMPGETATLTLAWQGHPRARMWLEVQPDYYYDTQVYDVLRARLAPGSPAAELIARADRKAEISGYHLFETEVTRPPTRPD